ncbi:hypothetical protein HED60_14185 [Planctomycetales bacterium ZRK34]|nr:hypothetical protein HED60_14185 [Planctomycetales bacterium ZRK34]
MWSDKLTEGSALGVGYEIYAHTGVVKHTDTRSETSVEGSFTGGTTTNYGGGVSVSQPGHGYVSSKTTNFQNIYLTDDEGNDHTVHLVDFLVACAAGHKLTMYMMAKPGKGSGTYFKAVNVNTRERYDHGKGARSELFPWRLWMGITGAFIALVFLSSIGGEDATFWGTVVLSLFCGALFGAVLWCVGWCVSFARATIATSDGHFKAHVSEALTGKGAAKMPEASEAPAAPV